MKPPRLLFFVLVVPFLSFAAASAPADVNHLLKPIPSQAGIPTTVAPADSNHFYFILSGDNRSTGRSIPPPPTPAQIFAEMRLLQPAFALWTGDTIYGSDDTIREAEAEYEAFLGLAARSNTLIYNAPGNHEIFDRKEMEALYERKMGRTYGSFDYGNSHFIALNTEEIGLKGGIGREQRNWLAKDLESSKKAAHIFAFMHHPLFGKDNKETWSDSANRDDVHRLFVKYNVKYVLSGHEHLYYRSVHDGLNYIVSGGAGAPSDAAPEDGGFQHFVLFEVNGPEVTTTVLEPWRAFVTVGPTAADGSSSAIASNYNDADLPFYIEFPESVLTDAAVVTATLTYKSKSEPIEAAIVPSKTIGYKTVRVIVKKHRSVFVTLRPK